MLSQQKVRQVCNSICNVCQIRFIATRFCSLVWMDFLLYKQGRANILFCVDMAWTKHTTATSSSRKWMYFSWNRRDEASWTTISTFTPVTTGTTALWWRFLEVLELTFADLSNLNLRPKWLLCEREVRGGRRSFSPPALVAAVTLVSVDFALADGRGGPGQTVVRVFFNCCGTSRFFDCSR